MGMSIFPEYEKYDGLGLAELVRRHEISAPELGAAAIERIEARNPGLNAVITPMFDLGLRAARGPLPDGPFAGVPFLLKDLLAAYAGVRFAAGCRAYRDYVPDYDSEMVARYKKAGLVILGKTNTPEFGLMGVTEPELFGPTRNPWNPEHTPGGSSGGSAAAVAAGMVPMAGGGDGGGSIRIPSSCCGLFGLKPTRFRTPTGPRLGRLWQGAAVEHVLTRSVRDSAAMLDALAGADLGAPFVIPPPSRPYLEEVGREPGSLRIAFSTASPLGTPVDEECRQATLDAARLLAELGHKVEEASPPLDGSALGRSFFVLYFGEVLADIRASERDTGKKPRPADFELTTWFFGELGKCYSAGDFVEAIRLWDQAARTMGAFHLKYDLLLTPTLAAPPARVGELKLPTTTAAAIRAASVLRLRRLVKATGVVEKIATEILSRMPFTQLANFTGSPAMSVPLFQHASGLPLGVQFIAPFGDEATLFRLAAQLEKARPWFERTPKPIPESKKYGQKND
jgi:amidase